MSCVTLLFRKKSKESTKENIDTRSEGYSSIFTSPVSIHGASSFHKQTKSSAVSSTPLTSAGCSINQANNPSSSHHTPLFVPFQQLNRKSIDYGIPPHSPVSPRVKNLDEDLEALTISRGDNPYILSRLEQIFNSKDNLTATEMTINVIPDGERSLITMGKDCVDGSQEETLQQQSSLQQQPSDNNVHQHLIRSPPPQYPQKLSHFVFPPTSPSRGVATSNISPYHGLSNSFSSLMRSPCSSNYSPAGYCRPNPASNAASCNSDSAENPIDTNECLRIDLDKSTIDWDDVRCESSLSSSREALLTPALESG